LYYRFLQNKLDANRKEGLLVFNNFFFNKLADDDMMHGKVAFE
jgi:hypothetical protein